MDTEMKIYTRRGDDGTTSLRGGGRLGKDSARIEALGSIDELNCCIGRVLSLAVASDYRSALERVQDLLFRLGSDLAGSEPSGEALLLGESHVAQVEQWIDGLSEALPESRHFILPGGSPEAAELFVARAVCRRAERRLQALAADEVFNPAAVPFLNRLGDLLFVAARCANVLAGQDEVAWEPAKNHRE